MPGRPLFTPEVTERKGSEPPKGDRPTPHPSSGTTGVDAGESCPFLSTTQCDGPTRTPTAHPRRPRLLRTLCDHVRDRRRLSDTLWRVGYESSTFLDLTSRDLRREVVGDFYEVLRKDVVLRGDCRFRPSSCTNVISSTCRLIFDTVFLFQMFNYFTLVGYVLPFTS